MAVKVARGLKTRIREDPGGVVIQVRKASDPEAAATALEKAAVEIAELDGGWQSAPGLSPGDANGPTFVSGVTRTPLGPFVCIDGGYTPHRLLATIPDIVARHLEEAGVEDAVVGWPREESPFDKSNSMGLSGIPRAVLLHLYPVPPLVVAPGRRKFAKIPPEWLPQAASWAVNGLADDDAVWLQIGLVSMPVTGGQATALFEGSRRQGASRGTLVTGVPGRLRVAEAYFLNDQWLTIGGGGSDTAEDELLAIFEDLARIARALSPSPAYAAIGMELTFQRVSRTTGSDWYYAGGADPQLVQLLCEQIVADAYPYQILGPGHLTRLSDPTILQHPSVATRRLRGGRVEVRIGDPADWLHESPVRTGMQRHARSLLTRCLLSDGDATELYISEIERNESSAK